MIGFWKKLVATDKVRGDVRVCQKETFIYFSNV
jgi:hypothetical protein